jgi:uncharacterized protein (DUF4415 family)
MRSPAKNGDAAHKIRCLVRAVPTGGEVTVGFRYNCTMARRPTDPRSAAEQAFKTATAKPIEGPPKAAPAIPGVKEMVSLRLDRDVLDFFQEDGPGWQDRINAALRKAAGR